MAAISGILFIVQISNISGAGTDGDIYLGIGGREFYVDSDKDDYEQNSYREYLLGDPPIPANPNVQVHVHNADNNDPRVDFPLDTDDLGRTPVYFRFEPKDGGDNVNLRFVAALVYTDQFFIAYYTPERLDNLWLGRRSGKILYLTAEVRGQQGLTLFEARRELAAQTGT
jgi:hypothetical protein